MCEYVLFHVLAGKSAMATLGGFTADQSTFINASITDLATELSTGPYQDVTVNYVLQSAYMVFFMHCGFAMVRPLHSPANPSNVNSRPTTQSYSVPVLVYASLTNVL